LYTGRIAERKSVVALSAARVSIAQPTHHVRSVAISSTLFSGVVELRRLQRYIFLEYADDNLTATANVELSVKSFQMSVDCV